MTGLPINSYREQIRSDWGNDIAEDFYALFEDKDREIDLETATSLLEGVIAKRSQVDSERIRLSSRREWGLDRPPLIVSHELHCCSS